MVKQLACDRCWKVIKKDMYLLELSHIDNKELENYPDSYSQDKYFVQEDLCKECFTKVAVAIDNV